MTIDEQTITDLVSIQDQSIVQSPEWWRKLKEAVNHLIVSDFSRLVQILYRADVSEEKIKNQLKATANIDAAEIIAGLFLQRQLEKIRSREQFKAKDDKSCNEEKW